jgi:hypothetical protein
MGRPLRKDVNGVDVVGNFTGGAGIVVSARVAGVTNVDYYIVKQRGARTYVLTRNGTNNFTCKTVAAIVGNNEMLITGNIGTPTGTEVAIRKLTKRLAVDFSGARYKWHLTNYQDSVGDTIILTAI